VYTSTQTIKTVDGTHAIINPDGSVEVLTDGSMKQDIGQSVSGGEVSDAWLDGKKWPPGPDQRHRIHDADTGGVCQ
jgi:hypothetical protein